MRQTVVGWLDGGIDGGFDGRGIDYRIGPWMAVGSF